MKIAIYSSVVHIDDDKVLVIPTGMNHQELVKKLKSESLVVSDTKTASGRNYVNFAPQVYEGEVTFVTLDTIKTMAL